MTGPPGRPATTTPDVRGRLARAAILTDFDGTLAPIVDDPGAVALEPEAREVLGALADRAAVVAVISGRPVAVLRRHLSDPRIHLSGLYGLERWEGGRERDVPGATRWLGPVAQAAVGLEARIPAGAVVEGKGLSLTIHYRHCPERAAEVVALAEQIAADHGLTTRPARMSVEVHPPGSPDKGTVVEELAAGCHVACFLGDDVGDLPAFEALDRLRDEGLDTVKVAVETEDSAPELVARADVLVEGSAGAVAWLRALL